MKGYSFKQVVVISIFVSLGTVAAVVAFRKSPFYHPVRIVLAGAGLITSDLTHIQKRTGGRLSETEINALRTTYTQIVKMRGDKVDPNAITQIMRAYRDERIQRSLHWFGIPTQKNPTDAWMMQQLIAEVRPDYIIEAGTWRGGSALFFATILEGLGLHDSKILTIDIEDLILDATREHPYFKKHVEFILGSSTDPVVVKKVSERVSGRKVMVFLDSLHRKEHVLAELRAYAPLVSPGSYLIVEDTFLDALVWPDGAPGPFAATNEFLNSNPRPPFERDIGREIFIVTNNPGGYLRRTSY